MTNKPIRLRLETVTPKRAEELLGHNTDNRRQKTGAIAQYARDMANGEWKDGAGEPVHIAPDGTLGNGQNRLLAIIESGVTVRLPFLYAPMDYRRVADQGARRSFGDTLMLEYHEPNSHGLASMVRMVRDFRETGEFGRRAGGQKGSAPTNSELAQTYLAEPNLRESMHIHHRESSPKSIRAGIIPSVAATCHYLFNEVDPEETDLFFEQLQRGTGLGEGSPILAARRWFANPDRSGSQRVQAAILIKAFNYWREDRVVKTLYWRPGGSKPESFPKILPPA